MTAPVTTPTASLDAPRAPAAKPAALWEDLVDVFTSPAEVFRRRRDGRFWLPLLVYTLLVTAAFYVARPVLRAAMQRQISAQIGQLDANASVPAEQRAALADQMRAAVDSPWALLSTGVTVPFVTLLTAIALWLVAKFFGSGASLGQSVAVTAIAGIPRAVLGLLTATGSLVLGREGGNLFSATASPAAFLGADASPALALLLSRFDLGVLWHTALLGAGIALMGRPARRGGQPVVEGEIPRSSGLLAAAIVWALGGLASIGQVLNS